MISDRRKRVMLAVLIVSLLAVALDNAMPVAATAISVNFFAMAGVYFFMSFFPQNGRGDNQLLAGLLTTSVAIGQLKLEWALSCTQRRNGRVDVIG
jgi:dolichyl-phosphate-mannose--protein O-mannosyl transferase